MTWFAPDRTPNRAPIWFVADACGALTLVFVTVVQGISECEQLADAVRRGPLGVDLRFPYHPHVTIAHDLADEALDRAFEELADFECIFDATGFSVYVHEDRSGWQPTRDFELGATDTEE